MISFTIRHATRGEFTYSIDEQASTFIASPPFADHGADFANHCPDCCVPNRKDCRALEALRPILFYFNELISHDHVDLVFTHDEHLASVTTKAHHACFILSTYGLFHSRCPTFNRYKWVLHYHRLMVTPEIYFKLLLSIVVFENLLLESSEGQDRVLERVATLNARISARINTIFQSIRHQTAKDAVSNSFVMILSMGRLIDSDLEGYFQRFKNSVNPFANEAYAPLLAASDHEY
jgi:hypothetical protein